MRYAWSLANQLANAVLVLILVAGPIAAVDIADFALAIDDDGTRHFVHVVRLAHLVRRIEQYREADRFACQQFLDRGRVLVDIDADQGKARRFVLLVHLIQQGHLLLAGAAPGCPEIHHDYPALVLAQGGRLSGQRRESKGGRRARPNAALPVIRTGAPSLSPREVDLGSLTCHTTA